VLDRFGAARVLLAGAAVMTVGSILFPLSHSLAALYAMRIVVGVGASLIFLSLVKEIDELFDERHFAMVLSAAIFLGYFGGVAGTFPFERAVNAFGWRIPLVAAGIVCGIALLCAWRLLHKAQRTVGRDEGFSMAALLEILRNRQIIPLSCAGMVTFGIYFLFQAVIGKKLLQDCAGFSSAAAASCTLMMVAVNMTGVGCSGFLSRLAGNRRKPFLVTAAVMAFLSTGLITLILWRGCNPRWLVPCYAMVAAAGAFTPIHCAAMKELNRPGAAGTAIGLLNGIVYLFIAIVMNLAGVVMDSFKSQAVITAKAVMYPPAAYIAILTACCILAAMSIAAALRIRETFGKSSF
jgi:predicted MFS family arabinose efflux permease